MTTTIIEHRRFHVRGRVQGVFFRQSAKHEARRFGLTGYARNNPDGTVTIEAEGPAQALVELESWCRRGPAAARVDGVEITTGPLQGYQEFVVRR